MARGFCKGSQINLQEMDNLACNFGHESRNREANPIEIDSTEVLE